MPINNDKPITSDPQICVGFRRKDEPEKDFGVEVYFSVSILGIAKALDAAQKYMKQQSEYFRDLEYKIWGIDLNK